jgi:hypothetical protein
MDLNKLGFIVGLLFVGFAVAAIAAGVAASQWQEIVESAHSRTGQHK